MTGNDYQKYAMVTSNKALTTDMHLLNGVMGMCGEAGECVDMVKKHMMQGHDLDKEHLAKEIGDVLWYVAEATNALGFNLDEIMRMNIDKLKARYPEGFEVNRSVNRQSGDV